MRRLPRPLLAALSAALSTTVAGAQGLPDARSPWALDVTLGAAGVPAQGAGIATSGTAPLVGLRLARELRPRLALTLGGSYGVAGEARRELYPRPTGPGRIVVYDFRMLLASAGIEYARPVGPAELVAGAEVGWVKEGWRVVRDENRGPVAPASSSFGGGPMTGVGLAVRVPVGDRLALTAGARVLGGTGTVERGDVVTLPELALRWRF